MAAAVTSTTRRRLYFGVHQRMVQRQAGPTDRRCPVDRHRSADRGCGRWKSGLVYCGLLCVQQSPTIASRPAAGAGPHPGKRFCARGEQGPTLSPKPEVCWSNCREAAFAGLLGDRAWAPDPEPCEPSQDTLPLEQLYVSACPV